MEVRDHRHLGSGCEAASQHVVMAAHSQSPANGKELPRALQDQDHQQEAQRGAAQGIRGGTAWNGAERGERKFKLFINLSLL